MLCDRLIAKTDILDRTDTQVVRAQPLSSLPLLYSSDEVEKRYIAAQQDNKEEIQRQDFSEEMTEDTFT